MPDQCLTLKKTFYIFHCAILAANAAGDLCDKSIKPTTIQKVKIMPKFF